MKAALVIVDVQNDFMPGGALPVPEGDKIIPTINSIISKFAKRIYTQDFHPKKHCSFKGQNGRFPAHCVEMTKGAELHKDLNINLEVDDLWKKGIDERYDAFSPFQDLEKHNTGFTDFLKREGIESLYICGVATEYCIKHTVLDAIEAGFKVTVMADAIAGIDRKDSIAALQEMLMAGASFTGAKDIKDYFNNDGQA